jgi:hypothetical protein
MSLSWIISMIGFVSSDLYRPNVYMISFSVKVLDETVWTCLSRARLSVLALTRIIHQAITYPAGRSYRIIVSES